MDSISQTETNRLAALRDLDIMDTPPSEAFDRITRLAAAAIRVPICLVSLVDETRQWFKSKYGIETRETAREASICAHAVQSRRPLLVPDTALDERFILNPLVTGPPHIRAYIGVPIFTRLGHAIGTLCGIDKQPHYFDSADIETLNDFARILEDMIHARELAKNTEVALEFAGERDRLFRDTFEFAGIGMVHVSLTGKLMRANAHLCEMLGYERGGLDRVSVIDLTHPQDISAATAAFRGLIGGQHANYRIEKRLRRRDGSYVWSHLTVTLRRSAAGESEYAIAVIEDISEFRRTRDELVHMRANAEQKLREEQARLEAVNQALREQAKNLLESDLELYDSEHRLQAVANNVPALIGYWNRDLRCEFANEAYRGMFQLEPTRVVGMHLKDLLGAERFLSVEDHARAALDGEPRRFEQTMQTADGSEIALDVRYIPDRDGTMGRGFFVLVTDSAMTRGPGIMSHLK